MAKYINPYTDFGFKKLFGEEANKDLLIDFLNQLLPEHHQIAELAFQNVEQLPDTGSERKAFFDIHCQAISGERFIIEMQKAKIDYFKDRSLYYLTYPIREQAQRGVWNFKLSAIYFIAVLDFWYEKQEIAEFHRFISLKDQFDKPFYDKLGMIYLQMPAFNKTKEQLETHFDKWAYFLKNLESFESIPDILKEPVFEQAFNVAEVSNFTYQQREEYEKSRLTYIEMKEVTKTALREGWEQGQKQGWEEGQKEGREEGRELGLQQGIEKRTIEAVLGLAKNGVPLSVISTSLNLELQKIEAIIQKYK